MQDLDAAISWAEQYVLATPDPRPGVLNNLGTFYQWRFERMGQPADLEQAIRYGSEAVARTSRNDPLLGGTQHSLANKFELRFKQGGDQRDLDEAILRTKLALELIPERNSSSIAFITHLDRMVVMRRTNVVNFKAEYILPARVSEHIYQSVYSGHPVVQGQIRLLSVQPSRDEHDQPCNPLICTLRAVNLGDKPKYVALSYTWALSCLITP